MEFSVDRNRRFAELPVPVVATPSNRTGTFMAYDITEGPLTSTELGFTDVPEADIDALEAGDKAVMDKYVKPNPNVRDMYQFSGCQVVIEVRLGTVSITSVIETF